MVGLSFELQDSYERDETNKKKDDMEEDEKKQLQLEIKYCNVDISLVDYFLYAFCYIGILTGEEKKEVDNKFVGCHS